MACGACASAVVHMKHSIHSHLITGQLEAVNSLLDVARKTGALNVSLLNVKTPYHSQLLKETRGEFQQFITNHIKLKKSNYPIISSIDQRMFESPDKINIELTNNLFERINWMASFDKLLNLGVTQFIECGAGKSLQRISRFMPGDFKVYPINKVEDTFG